MFVIALTKIYVILSDLCYLGVWQLEKITELKEFKQKMKTRQERKQEIKRFFDRLSPSELDRLLERNGINDKESDEALAYRIIKEEIEKGEI